MLSEGDSQLIKSTDKVIDMPHCDILKYFYIAHEKLEILLTLSLFFFIDLYFLTT